MISISIKMYFTMDRMTLIIAIISTIPYRVMFNIPETFPMLHQYHKYNLTTLLDFQNLLFDFVFDSVDFL